MVWIALWAGLTGAVAGEPVEMVNGCGPAWLTIASLNEIPMAGVYFEEACRQHDLCYSRCVGLHQTESCSQDWLSWRGRRDRCDQIFRTAMRRTCTENGPVQSVTCALTAGLFHRLVVLGGGITFDGKQVQELYRRAEAGEDLGPLLEQLDQIELPLESLDDLYGREPQQLLFQSDGTVTLAPFAGVAPDPVSPSALVLTEAQLEALSAEILDGKNKVKLDEAALREILRTVEQELQQPAP